VGFGEYLNLVYSKNKKTRASSFISDVLIYRRMNTAGVAARHQLSMAGSACGEELSPETKGSASVAVAR
jgi:hypothetical protein